MSIQLKQESYYLFFKEEFANVTLVCDDQKTLKANKSILSAASEFFRNIFVDNFDSECVVIFPGYDSDLLIGIINFIYFGQVQVGHERLEDFKNICNQFLIKAFNKGEVKQDAGTEEEEKVQVKQEMDILSVCNVDLNLSENVSELEENKEQSKEVIGNHKMKIELVDDEKEQFYCCPNCD